MKLSTSSKTACKMRSNLRFITYKHMTVKSKASNMQHTADKLLGPLVTYTIDLIHLNNLFEGTKQFDLDSWHQDQITWDMEHDVVCMLATIPFTWHKTSWTIISVTSWRHDHPKQKHAETRRWRICICQPHHICSAGMTNGIKWHPKRSVN